LDQPVFSGCFVAARLLGVIEAKQTEDGKTERNDRLIAVSAKAPTHRDVKTLTDPNATLLDEIEHFFVSYNAQKPKSLNRLDDMARKERSGWSTAVKGSASRLIIHSYPLYL
jgi:inorganic pyrophosphatase